MMLATGQILHNRYRILKRLGQGGMGAVYLAEDISLGRRCAVKENLPDPQADPQALAQMRQQFRAEAQVLANLDHPNLPRVHDFFSHSGNEYMVMEYVEGEDLHSLQQRQGGPLPEQTVLACADQVLDALAYLHSQQPHPIIHRDIKPANIILTPQGKVKLVDFGLVKLLDPHDPRTATVMKGMGTPEYAPLEQYASGAGHTDARSDIYSLGGTLYHLLTGVAPVDVHQRVLNPGRMASPRSINPMLSAGIETALLKALQIHPDQRYPDATALRRALIGAAPTRSVTPPVVSTPARQRRAAGWPLLVVGALAAIVVLALALRGGERSGTVVAPTASALGAVMPLPTETSAPSTALTPPPTDTPTQPARLVPPTETSAATQTIAAVEPITPTATVDSVMPIVTQTALPVRPATATSAPLQMPVSTEEILPTSTPMPDFVSILANSTVNLRSGPGTAFGTVGQLYAGQTAHILGKNHDGSWWQIERSGADPAWVVARLVSTQGPADQVAVAESIPELASVAAPAPAAAPVAAAPRPTGGGSFGYGVQAHMIRNDQAGKVMQMTKGMGFNWVKQQIEWNVFEASPGQIGWSEMDRLVDVATANGVNLLFSVVNAPDWAREGGFDRSVGGPPADPSTFANFLGAMAGKYCGTSLKAIEVWNEQNLHYEWGNRTIDPNAYMELLKPAYRTIKAACPSMTVISGALTPTGAPAPWAMDDFAYLDGMYRAGLRDYADGIGAHPSGYNVPPDVTWQDACATIQRTGNSFTGPCDAPHHSWSFRSTMEGYRNLMVKHGDANKRIWPTEFGWAAGGSFDSRYAYANDNDFQEQAAWTVEAYQMMKNWGWVGPAFLWNLNFRVVANGTEMSQWGIVDPGWNPLPVYNALASMPK